MLQQPRAGICLESQGYINAINVPEWRDMFVVKRRRYTDGCLERLGYCLAAAEVGASLSEG
jgi:hypothetical protein